MDGRRSFPAGLALGLLLGLSVTLYGKGTARLLSSLTSTPITLINCPADVNQDGWKTERNAVFTFEIRHPLSYELRKETGSLVLSNGTERIVFEKFHSTVAREVNVEMRQAGWKIADRNVYALTTSYFTNEDGTLSEEYLFIRDFPAIGTNDQTAMIRATITMSAKNPELLAAKAAGMTDVEQILTEPEQILSTFRFLQYGELPGSN
ncbi:MAG: hypothetical protein WCS85_00125 [Candidatus Peribacteraceae bacterium]